MSYATGSCIGAMHPSAGMHKHESYPQYRLQCHDKNSLSSQSTSQLNTSLRAQTIGMTNSRYSNSSASINQCAGVFDLATQSNYRKIDNWGQLPSERFGDNYSDFANNGWQYSKYIGYNRRIVISNNASNYGGNWHIQTFLFYTNEKTKYRAGVSGYSNSIYPYFADHSVGAIQVVNERTNVADFRMGHGDWTDCWGALNDSNWTLFDDKFYRSGYPQALIFNGGRALTSRAYREFGDLYPTNTANFAQITGVGTTVLSNGWNVSNNGTPTFRTGIVSGVDPGYNSSGNLVLPRKSRTNSSDNNAVTRVSNSEFCYWRSSGAARYDLTWMYTPRFTLKPHTLYSLRVAYNMTTYYQYATGENTMAFYCYPDIEEYRT